MDRVAIPLDPTGRPAAPYAVATDKGAISISRMREGQLHVYISPEFLITSGARGEGMVRLLAYSLADLADEREDWCVTECSRRKGGAYLVTLEASLQDR